METITVSGMSLTRSHFAQYVSGFVDGEGCFTLYMGKGTLRTLPTPQASFVIRLRADDGDVLKAIRDFWGCGWLYLSRGSGAGGRNPEATLKVATISDLHGILIPHFDAHPLLAKKRLDYAIWRQGVELYHRVQQRPKVCRGSKCGSLPMWSVDERQHFASLVAAMKQGRVYRQPVNDVAWGQSGRW